jgi:hypothetical protein
MGALLAGLTTLRENAAVVALIRAGHRTHVATEEAARTRLGFLRLTKGGQASTDTDPVFFESVHKRFCRPRHIAVSRPLDALLQAIADRTPEVSLHAASKAPTGWVFAEITPAQPPGPNAKANEAAADRRKAAAVIVGATS